MDTDKSRQSTWGGAGRGQGRKVGTKPGAGKILRKNITVDLETCEILTEYGEGNFSEGIRRAAKLIKESKK